MFQRGYYTCFPALPSEMGTQTNPILGPHETEEGWTQDPAAILHALDQILASPPFRNTQQGQNLLRYIVRHTLAGEDHLLRERVIGSEVFGRRPDYEPGFELVRAEGKGRSIHYTLRSYATERPPEERYRGEHYQRMRGQ